jgi:hypothetical protein
MGGGQPEFRAAILDEQQYNEQGKKYGWRDSLILKGFREGIEKTNCRVRKAWLAEYSWTVMVPSRESFVSKVGKGCVWP